MADTDIIVSEMTPASQINTGDLMIMTQPDAQAETGYSTKSGTVLQVANKMLKGTEYSTDLPDFTDKTPLGGLEELKADIKALLPVDSASGNPCNFETGIADALVSLKASILASGGGGTPSTPIPIVGHSELNLVRCGKNFTDISDNTISGAGYVIGGFPVAINADNIVLSGGNYVFSFDVQNATYPCACQLIWYRNGVEVGNTVETISASGINSIAFTASGDFDSFVMFCNSSSGGAFTNFNLNIGSTATSYAPYNGQTFTIDLGGTRYGGYVDAVRGKLVVTFGYANVTDLDFTPSTPASHVFRTDSIGAVVDAPTTNDDTTTAISSHFSAMDFSSISGSDNGNFAIAGQNYAFIGRLVFIDHRYSTIEDFIAGNNTTQIVYPLATPIEIDVSAISVEAVSGVNNIVSNGGGDIEVEYRDSIQHYIDSKIASVQALIL